jgi:chemotaxis protein CheD
MGITTRKGINLPKALPDFEHINRYWDSKHNVYSAKILPGEYYVTNQKELISTVLGSCVSACIRDQRFGIGGMNHFMLPITTQEGLSGSNNELISSATRYGNYAMEHLINTILSHGGQRENLEVKIFGGGRIISQMTDVGRKNIAFVREYLRTEGLSLTSEDVGEIYPRKVLYFPDSGRVRIKKLRSLHNDTIVTREKAYLHDIETKSVAGEIELF